MKLRSASAVVLAFALALGATAFAQSPRMALVEEATNASCGPCASQNPTFEAYLAQSYNIARAIPIIYHANWPGRDVMNAANPTMHNTRVSSYYGITGVPQAQVNGRTPAKGSIYAGAPADTVELSKSIAAAMGMSPLTITVEQAEAGVLVTVTVKVHSTTAISGKKLRIAVVEGAHHYDNAGTNGEKEFFYIVREMLPDAGGQVLTLNAGEEKTFTGTYTLNAEWTHNEMYAVAFVQDDATKEVLQAGTNKASVEVTTSGAAAKVSAGTNTPMEYTSTIHATLAGEYLVDVTKSVPAGWTAEALYNGVPLTSGQPIVMAANSTADIRTVITPAASRNRRGDIVVTVRGPLGASASQSYRLYAKDIDAIVLTRDEGDAQIRDYYVKAFDRATTTYAVVEPGDESIFQYSDFRVLFCEVGKSILVKEDVDRLKAYMDAGGRVFLTGAEIGWGLADPDAVQYGAYQDAAFLRDYLHASYVNDNANDGMVRGVTGDPISNGYSLSIVQGVQNQQTPDVIVPLAGAVTCFTYSTNTANVAGIRFASAQHRLVYLGFGLEGILSHAVRGQILDKGIQWLLNGEPTGVESAATAVPSTIGVYPNPARTLLAVPVTLEYPSSIRIALYDLTGRLRLSADASADRAGVSTQQLDVSALPSGTYMLHVTAGAMRSSRQVTITK